MTTLNIVYGSWTSITCTTTSLATSSTLLAGRQSAVVDNTTTLADDYLIGGTVASGSGTLTANTSIEIWLSGLADGTSYTAGLGGGDAAATLTSNGVKYLMPLAASITQVGTSTVTYNVGPISVANCFGGVCPSKFCFWIVHNTGQNLGATAIKYAAVTYTNA